MKLKLDENLDARLAEPLRMAGHDATTVEEQRLKSIDDDALLALCQSEDRIIVTLDLDFGNILRYPPSRSPGIVVLRGPSQQFSATRLLIEALVRALGIESPRGRLWIIEHGRLRVHEED